MTGSGRPPDRDTPSAARGDDSKVRENDERIVDEMLKHTRPASDAAHVFDFREIADYVVENEDTATAANALRNAQDEIDRLRQALIAISAIPYEAVGGKRAHELSIKALHGG